MSPALRDLALPVPLALVVFLAVIAAGMYAVRAHARRERRHTRRRLSVLTSTFSAFFDDRASAEDLRRAVRDADEGAFWSALEGISHRLSRKEWLRLSSVLERNRFSGLERRALRDDSPWRRALAARRLGLLRSKPARRALRRALVRGPELVTLAAAQSLARFGDRAALRWLLEHSGALARRTPPALIALLRSFGRNALPDLAASLGRDVANPNLERAIVETLGRARYRPARSAIEHRLGAAELDVRVCATRALGELQAIESATSLLVALKDDAWQVRAQAARALGRASAPVAIVALTARLSDPSWWVRRHAAYALAALGHEGRTALNQVAATSPDPYARDMAREALDATSGLKSA
ncbi:MAG TPA: HEAT repeat domain-containing protein [Candidatus Limnocylindria bacterium]|nr:HEAT repeat domain-containing protein [Candidatus Limnocylindria bacterium]